ncbi:MAG TPA: hypothetical protein VK306_02400 [Acidimicrobiales bacterium]|nr:hypothetical protein [Acidimicrobiales bacterium]
MADLLTTVTDAETKVVETIRGLQGPVVDYVRKGVDFADGKLPDVTYPSSLPKPAKVLDSQYDFVKSLLDAQHDLVKAIVETVAPLAGAETTVEAKVAKANRTAKRA